MLPGDAWSESESVERIAQAAQRDLGPGVPWFESMVSGSRLGSIQRSAGTKRDGNWSVEWEIVEWTEEEAPGPSSAQETESGIADRGTGKRKLDDPTESDTVKKGWNDTRG